MLAHFSSTGGSWKGGVKFSFAWIRVMSSLTGRNPVLPPQASWSLTSQAPSLGNRNMNVLASFLVSWRMHRSLSWDIQKHPLKSTWSANGTVPQGLSSGLCGSQFFLSHGSCIFSEVLCWQCLPAAQIIMDQLQVVVLCPAFASLTGYRNVWPCDLALWPLTRAQLWILKE